MRYNILVSPTQAGFVCTALDLRRKAIVGNRGANNLDKNVCILTDSEYQQIKYFQAKSRAGRVRTLGLVYQYPSTLVGDKPAGALMLELDSCIFLVGYSVKGSGSEYLFKVLRCVDEPRIPVPCLSGSVNLIKSKL